MKTDPLFCIIFVSKTIYEVAKGIAYEEIVVDGQCERFQIDNLIERLVKPVFFKAFTRSVDLAIKLGQATSTIDDIIHALSKLDKLKHLRLSVNISRARPCADREYANILKFFKLEQLQTITVCFMDFKYYYPGLFSTVALREPPVQQGYLSTWLAEIDLMGVLEKSAHNSVRNTKPSYQLVLIWS